MIYDIITLMISSYVDFVIVIGQVIKEDYMLHF